MAISTVERATPFFLANSVMVMVGFFWNASLAPSGLNFGGFFVPGRHLRVSPSCTRFRTRLTVDRCALTSFATSMSECPARIRADISILLASIFFKNCATVDINNSFEREKSAVHFVSKRKKNLLVTKPRNLQLKQCRISFRRTGTYIRHDLF